MCSPATHPCVGGLMTTALPAMSARDLAHREVDRVVERRDAQHHAQRHLARQAQLVGARVRGKSPRGAACRRRARARPPPRRSRSGPRCEPPLCWRPSRASRSRAPGTPLWARARISAATSCRSAARSCRACAPTACARRARRRTPRPPRPACTPGTHTRARWRPRAPPSRTCVRSCFRARRRRREICTSHRAEPDVRVELVIARHRAARAPAEVPSRVGRPRRGRPACASDVRCGAGRRREGSRSPTLSFPATSATTNPRGFSAAARTTSPRLATRSQGSFFPFKKERLGFKCSRRARRAMVRIKIISAGSGMTRTRPATRLDRPRRAPASPRAEPLDSPGAFPPLGSDSGPPSPTTPPSPRRCFRASRAALLRRFLPRNLRGLLRGSSWSSGSGSDVPAATPAVRAASEVPRARARVAVRARRRMGRRRCARVRSPRRGVRRCRARAPRLRRRALRRALQAVRRQVQGRHPSGARYRRARELVPGGRAGCRVLPTDDADSSQKKKRLSRIPRVESERERSRRRWYSTTSTPCSARRASSSSATTVMRLLMTSSNVLRRNSVPTTRRKTTRRKTSF